MPGLKKEKVVRICFSWSRQGKFAGGRASTVPVLGDGNSKRGTGGRGKSEVFSALSSLLGVDEVEGGKRKGRLAVQRRGKRKGEKGGRGTSSGRRDEKKTRLTRCGGEKKKRKGKTQRRNLAAARTKTEEKKKMKKSANKGRGGAGGPTATQRTTFTTQQKLKKPEKKSLKTGLPKATHSYLKKRGDKRWQLKTKSWFT